MTERVGQRLAGATNAVDSDRVELHWRGDLWFLGALILVAVSLVVSIVRALTDRYLPGSDWALIELQVRNVGTSLTPLVGAWSRFNWHHPGPLL